MKGKCTKYIHFGDLPLFPEEVLSFFLSFFLCEVLYADVVILRCATVVPKASDWFLPMKKASEEIMRKTKGKVKVKWYFSGIVGNELETAKKLKEGKINCAALTPPGVSLVVPPMRLLELPFFFNNYEEVKFIKKETFPIFSTMAYNKYGMKLIVMTDVGFVYIFSKEPIRKIEDIKGKIVWIWRDDPLAEYIGMILAEIYKARIFSLPIGDVRKYIDLIEVFYNAPYPLVIFRWDSAVRYYASPPLNFSFVSVFIRRRTFEKIPKEFRKVVEETIRKHAEHVSEINMRNNQKILKMLKKRGVVEVQIPESEVIKTANLFRIKAWLPLKDKIYPSWLIKHVMEKLSEFRKMKKKKGTGKKNTW